ncbi:DUF2795 domain-containing protein [Microbacterium sp.]|uniref:DUF2795 domain-containing protein n=1 Tax=Microbacterium sp. TaxID=51671 RepID=UPI002810D176|nr:DUF2795 domain-containing protein [Microbacterium sp.]
MPISPSLDSFLAGMEYPATKDDLLREAARDGLSAGDRSRLETLPDQSFGARWIIRYHLAQNALADALSPRSPIAA